jgi:predicted nucleic acid-binding protein
MDTWGWLALWDKKDSEHEKVKKHYEGFRNKRGLCVTTDYILDETFTLLFRRTYFEDARQYAQTILKAIKMGYTRLEYITAQRFENALQLRYRFQDKPKISFTDLTSFVVMEELDIRNVMTNDSHFEEVNLGF